MYVYFVMSNCKEIITTRMYVLDRKLLNHLHSTKTKSTKIKKTSNKNIKRQLELHFSIVIICERCLLSKTVCHQKKFLYLELSTHSICPTFCRPQIISITIKTIVIFVKRSKSSKVIFSVYVFSGNQIF